MLSTAAAVYQSPMAKYAMPQYLALRVAYTVFLHEAGNSMIVYVVPYFYYATENVKYKEHLYRAPFRIYSLDSL